MFFILVSYTFLVLPLMSYDIKILTGLLLSSLILLVIIFGFICTYIDPTDPAILEAEKAFILS